VGFGVFGNVFREKILILGRQLESVEPDFAVAGTVEGLADLEAAFFAEQEPGERQLLLSDVVDGVSVFGDLEEAGEDAGSVGGVGQ
jgi:hypothetical protein